MNLLIVGSKGFIGSYFATFFRKLKWAVFECDVSVDYGNPSYSQVDPVNSSYNEIFEKTSYDICINCSGAANVSDSITNPSRDFQLNVRNLYLILDTLRRTQPGCKFINLSSAAVYGNPVNLPINELEVLKPMSPYGYHKKLAEDICDQFQDMWNIHVCSLRIFSAYGNGLKKQLFWDIYKKTRNSSNLELFGTGNESRDFIHISDLAQAVECIIENASFSSEKINVANGTEVFIKDAVNTFLQSLEYEGKIRFTCEERKGDPNNWNANISVLKSFGYEQKMDISSGLKQYSDWVRTLG